MSTTRSDPGIPPGEVCSARSPGRRPAGLPAARLWRRFRDTVIRRLTWSQWRPLVTAEPGIAADWSNLTVLDPRDRRSWADPFPLKRDGVWYLFVEEKFPGAAGHISVLELDAALRVRRTQPVLQRAFHLSYPFLLEYQGHLYMVPEAGASGRIEAYHCDRFPDQWSLHATLMQGVQAADPTLWQHGDRWWLFVTMGAAAAGGTDDGAGPGPHAAANTANSPASTLAEPAGSKAMNQKEPGQVCGPGGVRAEAPPAAGRELRAAGPGAARATDGGGPVSLARPADRVGSAGQSAAAGAPEQPNVREHLFLFHADSPLSTSWTPHPLNPVVSDRRCARPAGRLFVADGQLHRPAQDCTRRYGYAVRIQRITRLDAQSYAEEEAACVLPLPGNARAVHTLNRAPGLTVIDAKRRRLRGWR